MLRGPFRLGLNNEGFCDDGSWDPEPTIPELVLEDWDAMVFTLSQALIPRHKIRKNEEGNMNMTLRVSIALHNSIYIGCGYFTISNMMIGVPIVQKNLSIQITNLC